MSIFYVAVHALVRNNENKVLVTKRAKCNDYMPLKWDIPGGTVEEGETVEEALIRELKEETKIDIKPIKLIYAYSNLSQLPTRQTIQLVYTCEFRDGAVILNREEHEEYKWVEYSELKHMDCIAFLRGLIENYNLK